MARFSILGSLELRDGDDVAVGLGGVRERSLLALLLLNANELLSTDRIVDELWGDRPPKAAVKTVQVYVSRLRKILGADVLATRPPGYVLHVDDEQFDLRRFERLAADGRSALSTGDVETARRLLREALALWRGAPLSDFVYEPFAQAEAARLKELRVATIEDRIEADLQAGQAAELVSELQALTAREPLRERLRGQLMLALYRSGRQADALDVYRDARTTLVEELGLEPGPELKKLERAILTQDPALERSGESQAPRAAGVFVGRGAELRTVLGALADARDGRGGVLLLSGEPGIGKTRLADEVVAHARDQGMQTARGRCWEDAGAPAYWPWVELLRACIRSLEPDELRRCLGSGAPELAELLPDLREVLGEIPRPVVRDPEALRFRLFNAVASFLGDIATTERPLLVVLDDLHGADEPSLLLLGYLAGAVADRRVLVLGAYRDTERGSDDALERLVAGLLRERRVTRVALGGLQRDDVEEYVRLSTGEDASAEVVRALHSHTAGNPLFIVETVRLLAGENQLENTDLEGIVPAGVRDAVGLRLAPLPAAARQALTVASVLGRQFDPEILERLAGEAAIEGVDIAIAARLVNAAPGAPGILVFSHALVRDAIYEAIPTRRRRELHRRAGEALERRHAADLGRHLAQLAHHFYEAGNDERARRYAVQAAELAASRLAYEEAVRLYRLALTLAERDDDADRAELCDLLLGLGDAQARAGDDAGARHTFLRAAEVARDAQLAEHMGRAALGYGGRWVWTKGIGDPHLLPLLEEAVETLPREDSALRARLLARLAAGPLQVGDANMARRRALSAEAVQIARRLGDAAVLAWALDGRKVAIWAPDTLEEQWEIMDEMQEIAERVGDPEQIVDARICRLIKLMERAELDRFDAEYAAARRVADELGQPGQRWLVAVHEPIDALLKGRLANTEQLIEQAFGIGRKAVPWNARIARLRQRVVLFGLEGRPEDAEEELLAAATEEVLSPSWKAELARHYADIGDTARCRTTFEALAGHEFAGIPFDAMWTYTVGVLGHACAFLEDRERAAILYERMEPYAHRNLVAPVEVSLGSSAWPLGRLAATLGEVEAAARWFGRAAAENERVGALPWAAHARLDHARLLIGSGDHAAAEPLLNAAAATYRELGMDAWVARCELATATA